MKVLWLRPDKPDDISVGRHRIAIELEERGFDVDVRNTTVRDFWTVLRESPDVVVGTTRLGAFVGVWKKLVSGTPLVIDHIDPIDQLKRSHGPLSTRIVDVFERLSFTIADHVMVVYDEELQRVTDRTAAVTKTALGVDYESFSNPTSDVRGEARDRLADHVPEDARIVIYVGGIDPPYHLSEIVEAVDTMDGWHFVVLGDGSRREWLEEQAAVRSDVHYLGTVPYEEVPGYLHSADVAISLLDDPNTLKVLEYGASGTPVVHARGTAEAVYDGMVRFTEVDAPAIAEAVRDAVELDPSPLGELAKERSWRSIADQYEAVIRSVSRTP